VERLKQKIDTINPINDEYCSNELQEELSQNRKLVYRINILKKV